MDPTRLDRTEAADAIARATDLIKAASAQLEAISELMTERERRRALKPSQAFEGAARAMVELAASEVPALADAAGFDGEALLEDLDNARALDPLLADLDALQQRAKDARLRWLSEAYQEALPLYRLASAAAATDPKLQLVMRPLREAFGRGTPLAPSEDADDAENAPAPAQG